LTFELLGVERSYEARSGSDGKRRKLTAVSGVELRVRSGETLSLVGESGCGKSTLARLLLRLERPDAGRILYGGVDLWTFSRSEVRRFRREVQMVFQDPYASLNPRMRAGEIVGEPLAVHNLCERARRGERIAELLEQVGLAPETAVRYPRELSGGQRQRVGIARALAVDPVLVVADEPVSALDVSVQAQVLNVFQELKAARGLTYLFISHDLRVVRHISDRVAVMYLGRLAEVAPSEGLFGEPLHPYTRALLASVPRLEPTAEPAGPPLQGELPSPFDLPCGCPFHPRCPEAIGRCAQEEPLLRSADPERMVACHLAP
jgi:oligopeptide/dipeptide ABC transporter ATP-binding protein